MERGGRGFRSGWVRGGGSELDKEGGGWEIS